MEQNNENFQVGVKGILRSDQKILLLHAPDQNGDYWDFPGGRIQQGENLEQALLREIAEEVPSLKNVKVNNIIHAARLEKLTADGTDKGLIIIFFEITAKFNEIILSHEHDGFRWVTNDDIPDLESDSNTRLTQETEKTALTKAFKLFNLADK